MKKAPKKKAQPLMDPYATPKPMIEVMKGPEVLDIYGDPLGTEGEKTQEKAKAPKIRVKSGETEYERRKRLIYEAADIIKAYMLSVTKKN